MRRLSACAVAAISFGFSLQGALQADWPTFRGSDRTAVAPDKNLLDKWPEQGPKLVYDAVGAGRGYASVAIADGKMYTLGDAPSTASDKSEYLSCFDAKTGKQLWALKTGEPWNNGNADWQGSRSTPTVDGDRVYVVTPFGLLVAAKTSGEKLWEKNLKSEFGGDKADIWGYSESVLIDGDALICTPGKEKSTMISLDKMTGELKWNSSRPGDIGAGHGSVVISQVGKTKVYVNTTGSGAMGVRASDGKLLWSYPMKAVAVIPTSIVRDDLVFVVAGYGLGGALLRQIPDGDSVKIEEIYPLKKDLGNKHGGVVLVGNYLYADSDDKGILYCADLLTGKIEWKERGSGKNSTAVAAADGQIYLRYADGTMALVNANPKEHQEVSHFTVPHSGDNPSWAHPVIDNGRLYLREGDHILCYDIKQ
jgi:outer membrane protein assembly factor BamB